MPHCRLMEWLQLLGPAAAAAVTGILLLWQNAKQREHQKEEWEKERQHQRQILAEERASVRDDQSQARHNEARDRLEAAHIEFLAASDEIYFKLRAHQQMVAEHWDSSDVFLPAEPNLTRLAEAHGRLSVMDTTAKDTAGSMVELLVDIHNVASAESKDSPTELQRLDEYPGLRDQCSKMTEIDLQELDDKRK